MKVSFVTLAVLSSVLTKNVKGKELIYQTLDKPVVPLAFVIQLGLNVSATKDSDKPRNGSSSSVGVTLPDVHCDTESDCTDRDDKLTCVNNQCTCQPPYCWVYHHESSAWTERNVFSCGECGQLGSSCNDSMPCDSPGECWIDQYCHCPAGENYDGICTVIDDSWAYKFTLAGFGIVFLVSFLVILVHLYRNRSWNQNGPWCCSLCKRTRGSRDRDASQEKTPAYTVRNHYASQLSDFNDEPRTGASSTNFQHQYSQARGSSARAGSGSITSAGTESTSISASSGVTENTDNLPVGVYQTTNASMDMQRADSTSLTTAVDDMNNETSSAAVISSCAHERCNLCLPKGLSTRENSNSSSPRYADGCSMSATCTDIGRESSAEHPITSSEVERECTSL
ncbi:uncharacterized protein LOC135198482 [Macrobrachium nipponense]|uniref:uncharacterized protein LOC135198482 n=1 Tax=Macrobrachium nipponense TaxID=159736 RepID=UPI0030C86979